MDIITQSEGNDILAHILEHTADDEDYVAELAEKFELTPTELQNWLTNVKVKASDVAL